MSASSQLIQFDIGPKVFAPKPTRLRAKAPVSDNFRNLNKLTRGLASTPSTNRRNAPTSENAGTITPQPSYARRHLHPALRIRRCALSKRKEFFAVAQANFLKIILGRGTRTAVSAPHLLRRKRCDDQWPEWATRRGIWLHNNSLASSDLSLCSVTELTDFFFLSA
jgi:hypothetical protein